VKEQLVVSIALPGFNVDDVVEQISKLSIGEEYELEEELEQRLDLRQHDVVVVFLRNEGDSPSSHLQPMEGRIVGLNLRPLP
jgi:hypothetical protein